VPEADRQANVLRANAAHIESHAEPEATATALAAELKLMASWLGLSAVEVEPKGALSRTLKALL
jgi:hypothetical protein